MDDNKDKDNREENEKRLLIALAILLGFTDSNDVSELESLTRDQLYKIKEKFQERHLADLANKYERISERDIQIEMANKGVIDGVRIFKIVGVKDDRTCQDCASWQNKEVTMYPNNLGLPLVEDFINNHGFHPNCRCSLQEQPNVSTNSQPKKETMIFHSYCCL